MSIVGVTGGIACGKTTLLSFFHILGVECLDCDEIVKKAYKDKEIKKALEKEFGTSERKKISRIAFKNYGKRKKLESIILPFVLKELREQRKQFRKGTGLLIAEVPLLYELRLEKMFDCVIVVKASKNKRIERIMKQGYSKKEALERIEAQIPLKEKIKKADFVINNNAGLEELRKETEKVFLRISEVCN